MAVPLLFSERLVYKPLGLSHATQEYLSWLNDYDVYKYLETRGNYTFENLETFLKEVERKSDILFWAIHIKENDKHIGNIKIDPINTKHNFGEYGILMGDKKEWGKGYAKEASLAIMDFCFATFGLRKMTLGVVEENTAAYQLYLKLGFKVEGEYKHHLKYDDTYHHIIRMAIFNPAFNP